TSCPRIYPLSLHDALPIYPADLVAANNCASLGLLLTGDSSARRLATKLHAENPTNAAFDPLHFDALGIAAAGVDLVLPKGETRRSEEHTSELQSLAYLVCR